MAGVVVVVPGEWGGEEHRGTFFLCYPVQTPTSLKNSTFEPGLLDLEKVYVSARETRTYFI